MYILHSTLIEDYYTVMLVDNNEKLLTGSS